MILSGNQMSNVIVLIIMLVLLVFKDTFNYISVIWWRKPEKKN